MLQTITTKPGDKYRSIRNPRVYEALRKRGYSKARAAAISNAQAKKRRHKAYTLDQLERYVHSPCYDPAIAQAIAAKVPELPRLKGEQIAPGITRIRGNLCNVHGRYGKCPGASAAPAKKPAKGRKPRKAPKPKQTPEQRAQERQQQRQANFDKVAQQMADNDAGLSPSGTKALLAFSQGQQPDARMGEGLARMGLAERADDGSYRMTPTGRAAVSAMQAGDYQRAVDTISRGTDAASARRGRQAAQQGRQQAAAQRRAESEAKRQQHAAERVQRQSEQAKRGAGGGKKPSAQAEQARPRQPMKRVARGSAPSVGGVGAKPKPKPKPAAQPEKQPTPEKQEVTPALAETARNLSDGQELSKEDAQALIRNGLARLNKDGELILTAAGQRAVRQKSAGGALTASKSAAPAPIIASRLSGNRSDPSHPLLTLIEPARALPQQDYTPSFKVFKDTSGRWRWVAQSSTAYQDRDREIVSTKALADDCDYADETGQYGVLRWWHSPGLDLGDCDFNAMHGRVLIESGTFRSEAIAQKVARAADQLEISLGFLHPPTEPTPDGVFHHIRRFERSLVPRGKASNRFTAFAVKEQPRMDATKIAGLKAIGFGDDEIADILARADKTEKAAAAEGVAFKADEPATDVPADIVVGDVVYKHARLIGELPDSQQIYAQTPLIVNGAAYFPALKAFPPKAADEAAEEEATEEVVETDAIDDMPMDDDEPTDPNALTLSAGDLSAITEIITAAVGQIMGGLDLEKKVAGHVQGMLAPYQQAQATKDAETASTREQIVALAQQVAEIKGDAPAVPYRASQARDNVLSDAQLLATVKDVINPNANPFEDLKRHLIG